MLTQLLIKGITTGFNQATGKIRSLGIEAAVIDGLPIATQSIGLLP